MMTARGSARTAALLIAIVAAAVAAAALFVLLRDGGCVHALLGLHRDVAMTAMPGMPGMEMPAAGGRTAAPCSLLLGAALALLALALGGVVLLAEPALARALRALVRRLAPGIAPQRLAPVAVVARGGIVRARRRPSRAPPVSTI